MALYDKFDYAAQLEKELESMYVPKASPADASLEELVRDLHHAMYGNPSGGLCVKVASINAQVTGVRAHLERLNGTVAAQVKRCNDTHGLDSTIPIRPPTTVSRRVVNDDLSEEAKELVEDVKFARTAFSWIKPHLKLILIVFICGLLYIFNLFYKKPSAATLDEESISRLEVHMNNIVLKQVAAALAAKNHNAKEDTSPDTRSAHNQ